MNEERQPWPFPGPRWDELHAEEEKVRRLERDAARYKLMRSGKLSYAQVRSILNDSPEGIDAAVDALDEKRYYAHRLAWLMVTGAWPLFIDHRDGDRANNRFPNLRDVTRSLNMQNRRTAKATNATGRLGVTIDKRNGRFIAQIVIDRRHVHLGCFDDPDAAHLVYLAAKRTHHEGNTL